ncbi:Glycosyl hydrolase family 17 protein [Arabidopsis thaliana]|jgi:exo-beta-1,3-glucanase (GH17 family)|uniref:glucan endo-1,3-beta-D-glucosidase n=2 Tax=Arabidopsis thaliana TaxID=3702 RepID=Q8VY12_ARATH|nr:Glycosyl hydrolase family 17 protein [Arabidopsis thaliana]AAL66985.1 putative beta-1,3-glucanase [Arabidopsis thaliana]AAN12906.1 putative beta-1,3-glucanase [Arabidopsis thaliana]AED94854.1 Glycosyl hydrolase family 17 protein [Arabidopsis thaliana]|eukprot:NP_199086.2 Glycosyl hydrolase family 17 protein [Arabidopsis thaliana]
MRASVYSLILLFFSCLLHLSKSQPFLGVNYGLTADNLPPPSASAKLLQSTTFQKVRLYGSDPAVIKALANTGIEIVIGASNGDVPGLASDPSFARSWVETNVVPYYPASKIVLIAVGNEITSFGDNSLMSQLLPAMKNVQTALEAASLGGGKIKVSTVHIMSVLAGSDPPSTAVFKPEHADILKGLLEFNSETGSPFAVNPYPFFAYQDDRRPETLAYCLFQANPGRVDPNSNLKYMNMFDAQVDAVYSALNSMGFKDVEIMVAETGWPYKGDPEEAGATVENARAYNKNLIAHLKSGSGTPLMPGRVIDTYLFALYDENLKPGKGSERAFGLFRPDLTMTYDIGLTKTTNYNQTSMAPLSPTRPRLPPAAAPTRQTLPSPPQMILPSPVTPSDKNSGQTDVHNSTPRSASLAHICRSLSISASMFFVSVLYALIILL